MRECENPDAVWRFQIRDMIGKATDGRFAGQNLVGDTGNPAGCERPAVYSVQRGINGGEELDTKTGSLALVPESSVFQFDGGFRFGSEGMVHRSGNRRPMRARTSSHGSPTDLG